MNEQAIQQAENAVAQRADQMSDFFKQCLQVTELRTEEHLQWAVSTAQAINDTKKQAETERKSITGPINSSIKKINDKYKPLTQMCDRVIGHLKTLAVSFQEREAARVQAELAAAATTQSHAEIVRTAAQIQTPVAGLSQRKNWTWELVDIEQVPREYFVLDVARLDREAKEREADLAVPGIKPVNKPTVVLR